MIDNMDVLFELIENSDEKDYTSLLFNIYEDKDYFTIEASFDDDNFVIGRDNPFTLSILSENTPSSLRRG